MPRRLTPMRTIIEGMWDQVTAIVTDCFEAMQTNCERIGTHIKIEIDYRAGHGSRIKSTIDAVEKKLGRKLST